MFLLIGNSGSNHNYIGLTLANRQIENKFAYHNQGTHRGTIAKDVSGMSHKEIKRYINDKNPSFLVCFASKWTKDLHQSLSSDGIKIIQILIDKHRECLLINWQEKLRVNAIDDTDRSFSKDWERQQILTWRAHTEFPIERAVMEWTYKLYDDEFVDVKQSLLCDQYFSFGSMYETMDKAIQEFKKFGIDYDNNKYEKWKQSQKLTFDSLYTIKHNLYDLGQLKHDYQRGIAIALRGISESLTPIQCWTQYEPELKVKL